MTVSKTNGNPILSAGIFGTHIINTGPSIWCFTGSVPVDIKGAFQSFEEALDIFKDWFLGQSIEFQREHAPNLRNDVFSYIFG